MQPPKTSDNKQVDDILFDMSVLTDDMDMYDQLQYDNGIVTPYERLY